jgi:hypothetical protein
MAKSRYALRGCTKVLCRGERYVIGEVSPAGFGIWDVNGILCLAAFPPTLEGWNAALDRFAALGDTPVPRRRRRRTAA